MMINHLLNNAEHLFFNYNMNLLKDFYFPPSPQDDEKTLEHD